ncbi:MAG TPA: hypothetical protein PKL03_06795 [Candidatus Omnitrophota bacterium]|nr:hypothetical protein [Candidatus Omnitrophota bacterium]
MMIQKIAKKAIISAIIISMALQQAGLAQVSGPFPIPSYISGYVAPDKFRPMQLRCLSFDQARSQMDFYLDQGDIREFEIGEIEKNAKKISDYFQVGLRLPDTSFWVNLRPDSPERIIDPSLENTDLGKVMLEADLQLKKDMAGFVSPRTAQGRQYWNHIYTRAEELFGGEEINVPTHTRPWIVPGEIIIRQSGNNAYIYKATLKVMLEQDYIQNSTSQGMTDPRTNVLNDYSSALIRQDILPLLTREVNSSRKYADLRQVYYALILAQWFKRRHRAAGSEDPYSKKIDSCDTHDLASNIPWSKESYFEAYRRSFSKGEYNIQETVHSYAGLTIRQYFSGGMLLGSGVANALEANAAAGSMANKPLPGALTKDLLHYQYRPTVPGVIRGNTAMDGGDRKALGMGTSGIRDLVKYMTDLECYINVKGYLRWLQGVEPNEGGIKGERDVRVYIAGDYRSSTDRIMRAVARAVEDEGFIAVNCGLIPSPAVALYAFSRKSPSIMVTGSHIADDRNGIKANKTMGEVLKSDEAGIKAAIEAVRSEEYAKAESRDSLFDQNDMFKTAPSLSAVDVAARSEYVKRYTDVFPQGGLQGKRIVLYQHSAVGRDILKEVLEYLGAEVIEVARSEDAFIPVDTEVISPELAVNVREWITQYNPFAVIFMDGDSDRPGVFDEKGRFIWGDLLGILVSQYLKADFAAVTISSNDAIYEALSGRTQVVKTQIGSPHVVKAMQDAKGFERVVSWEGNGGFLLQSDLELYGKRFSKLPTRDAVLPIVSVLLSAAEQDQKVSAFVDGLPPRFKHADLKKFTQFPDMEEFKRESAKIIDVLSPQDKNVEEVVFLPGRLRISYKDGTSTRTFSDTDSAMTGLMVKKARLEQAYFGAFGAITAMNMLDGVRIQFADTRVLHFRASGNAPEFRCYATAGSQDEAEATAKIGLERILPQILEDLKDGGALDYVRRVKDIVAGKVSGGFDYITTGLMTKVERDEVEQRYFHASGSDIFKHGTFNIPTAPQWPAKDGNGMGTVNCLEEFLNTLRERAGTNFLDELKRGKSAILVHTAGDATRLFHARTMNNKPLIEILPGMSIMDAAIKQAQGMAIPGKVFVTWGDQAIFPASDTLQQDLEILSQKHQVLLFGIDYPADQFTPEDARSYGWQVIKDGYKVIGFDDTRDYDAIRKKIDALASAGHDVTIRWNMGSFALSAEVIEMFFDAFRPELEAKTGFFNSDEVWQAWLAKDRQTFIYEFSKGDAGKRKQAEYVWDKVDPIKQKLVAKYGEEGLIASVGLGTKADVPQFDFGTNMNYVNSLRKLLSDTQDGKVIREFLGLSVVTEGVVDHSVMKDSHAHSGRVVDSVLINAAIEEADIDHVVIQHSKINKVVGTNGFLFNVIDDGIVEVGDNEMVFDVFHPHKGKLRFRFQLGVEQTGKDIWWSGVVGENPMSLEKLKEEMSAFTRSQIIAAKESALEDYGMKGQVPLALSRVAAKHLYMPNWPRIQDTADLSYQAQAFLALPGLVDNLVDGKFGYGFHWLYALAYLRNFEPDTRQRILGEIRNADQNTAGIVEWFEVHLNDRLEQQVPEMVREFDLALDAQQQQELIDFVRTHDLVTAVSRGLRIATEVQGADARVLFEIYDNKDVMQVITGLRSAVVIDGRGDMKILREKISRLRTVLWGLRQIEGVVVNAVQLPDGRYYVYDEYKLQYLAAEKGLALGVTQEGLEHLIKVDMTRGNGVFFEELKSSVDQTKAKMAATIADAVFTARSGQVFTYWDPAAVIYRAGSLGQRVFEVEKTPVDTLFIATFMRPEALKTQLESEFENWKIFGMRADVIVIDDSDKLDAAVLALNRDNLSRLSGRYGVHIVHLDNKNALRGIKSMYAQKLKTVFEGVIESGKDAVIEQILQSRNVLKNGVIDTDKMFAYLDANAFQHISGVRNHTVLLGKGEPVIMNVDDDAPPETYTLTAEERQKVTAQRMAKRDTLIHDMMVEVGRRLGKTIDAESRLYEVLADSALADRVRDIEIKYFGYHTEDNAGLIPQAMEQIKKLEDQYLDKIVGNVRQDAGLGTELKLTHQRYQSLMDPQANSVTYNDSVYYMPRIEKKEAAVKTAAAAYDILPVNTLRAARIVGRTVEDAKLSIIKNDLRGTMAEPIIEAVARDEMKRKTIAYSAHPFGFDQDTGALSQFIRYLGNLVKLAKNLQHTDQMALVMGGVKAFAAHVNVIFNRAALSNLIPTPSTGRKLRLEEPPYHWGVQAPVWQKRVAMAYSPVIGGQQRSIGERLYIISEQDFTELVGGAARYFYETAVSNYYDDLAENEGLHPEDMYRERMRLLGKHYIDVADTFVLNADQREQLLKQRQIRARLATELGRQRGQKQADLDVARARGDEQEIKSLEKQIMDMDLIQVHYANSFFLNRLYKPEDAQEQKDFRFRAVQGNYMYRLKVSGDRIVWRAVQADVDARDVVVWKELEMSGMISRDQWAAEELLEIEPGRFLVIKTLPDDGQEMIAPAIPQDLQDPYFSEISKTASDQIRSDGELIYLWPYILDITVNWKSDPLSGLDARMVVTPALKDGGIPVSKNNPPSQNAVTALEAQARRAALENDNASLQECANKIFKLQEQRVVADFGKFGNISSGISLPLLTAKKFLEQQSNKGPAGIAGVLLGTGAVLDLRSAAQGLESKIFTARMYSIQGPDRSYAKRLVLYYTAAGLKGLYMGETAPRGKDGGKTLGGIDFRILPSVVDPADASEIGMHRQSMASMQDLDKQWSDIQKILSDGRMPYQELKEYVSCCVNRREAAEQMRAVTTCITGILKLEEERAISTAPELKEILSCLG